MAWLFSMGLTGWLVTALVTLLLLWMWKSYRSFTVFSRMGIPTPPPLPIIGNAGLFFKYGTIGFLKKFQEKFGKVYGFYSTSGPMLVVADLDMLREILVKQFQYFPNRQSNKSGMSMKPWKDGLTQLTGDHWKHVRSTLSPTFSSGKMKRMMPGIQQVAMVLKDHLNDKASQGEMIELKDLCGRFSMDVIGAVAFGMDVSSIQNPQHNFVKQARVIMNPSKLVIFFSVISRRLMVRLNRWGLLGPLKEAQDFFQSICEKALKDRQTDMQSQKYHDFLQLLVESEIEGDGLAVDSEIDHENHLITSDKWTRKGLTKDEMVANALIFILAGFETVATTLSYTLFLLAHNPDCVKKAQDELDSKLGKSMVNYETANALSYLEMCISESLRLYPSGFILVRSAAEDVEIKGVKFLKDMGVLVPVALLHKDPEVWPEPEKFDPMRFTPEERAGRHPMSFMPFGMGPRNCIGLRLAQLEVRMALATILQHFTPVLCEKTVYPPRLAKFQLVAKDGLWIKLEKRE